MGVIYEIISPSSKRYIGKTKKTAEKRWKEHIEDAHNPRKDRCKALNRAIRKYGRDNFIVNTLLSCNDELLLYYEAKFIELYQSYTPELGYNIIAASQGVTCHTNETKQRISEALIGRPKTLETKQKMVAGRKPNKQLPMYLIEMRKKGVIVGYRVVNHPELKEKRFGNPKETMESKLQQAINYLERVQRLNGNG
jgi:group I intron endonuclease